MGLTDILSRGLKHLEAQVGSPTMTYRGTEFVCMPSTENRGLVVEKGGKSYTIELTIFVRRELLGDSVTMDMTTITMDQTDITMDASVGPRAGKRMGFRSRTYRVIQVKDIPGSSHWEIDLGNVNK
jgi:hypothetical protein